MHDGDAATERITLARHLPDETATLALGAQLAAGLAPGLVLYLRGDLGAGKTTLARGLLHALGHTGRVKSPTYTLVELYNLSNLCLHHFDFYRFENPQEWLDAGLREAFGGPAVCLVEWPDKAGPSLPPPDVEVTLSVEDLGRRAELQSRSAAGGRCLKRLLE